MTRKLLKIEVGVAAVLLAVVLLNGAATTYARGSSRLTSCVHNSVGIAPHAVMSYETASTYFKTFAPLPSVLGALPSRWLGDELPASAGCNNRDEVLQGLLGVDSFRSVQVGRSVQIGKSVRGGHSVILSSRPRKPLQFSLASVQIG